MSRTANIRSTVFSRLATLPSNPGSVHAAVRALLDARTPDGHWEGELSSSPLSTATAVVSIALFSRGGSPRREDEVLVHRGIAWLLTHQNADGGWGDTDLSVSNISTTALVWAALAFGLPTDQLRDAEQRAIAWLRHNAGGIEPATLTRAIVARYGKDRTFSVPILTMCALAGRFGDGRSAWRLIPQLPFELAVIPRRFFTTISLPVVSYALPALITMGLARHQQCPSRNPVARIVRRLVTRRALAVLDTLQPPNGGFLEATPLTSFVTMTLVAAGHGQHRVARKAIDFLRSGVRQDGSWPIDTNLATWLTTLSIQALGAGGDLAAHLTVRDRSRLREWLLAQQTRDEHPFTGAARGAWAWTNLPGGVPDADDTAGALLALHALGVDEDTRAAAAAGVEWLLNLQNRDGGMPTFCRGWGALPFDRSGADLTAHAMRAWIVWKRELDSHLASRVDRAIPRAVAYLLRVQRSDGAFVPLWFGNQHAPDEENPTYGTSRVLVALDAIRRHTSSDVSAAIRRAAECLARTQNADGGWGGGGRSAPSSVEETALVLNTLADLSGDSECGVGDSDDPIGQSKVRIHDAAVRGAAWLRQATQDGTSFPAAPIGFYFAKLWYYERLYPLIFTAEALGRATQGRTHIPL